MDRGEIIIYQTADGDTRLDVRMEDDSVWLTQAQIAQLFGVDRTVIVRHVNNIYKYQSRAVGGAEANRHLLSNVLSAKAVTKSEAIRLLRVITEAG